MSSTPEAKTEVGGFRLSQWPSFLGIFVSRLVKGGQVKRDGHEVEVEAAPDAVAARNLSSYDPVQLPRSGDGPLFYRHYGVKFAVQGRSAEQIMELIKSEPNLVSPQALARFKKTKGSIGKLRLNDEFLIEITGPWNGPVRVIAETPTSFSFATLKGHMESGEIRFEVNEDSPGNFHFDIYSWARSTNPTVDMAYDKLKVAKAAQTEMWTLLCENIVKAVDGEQRSDVLVETKETPYFKDPIPVSGGREPNWKKYQTRLEGLKDLKLNFELGQRDSFTQKNGWNVDKYRTDLPSGSFEIAKRILQNYEFPDPSLIQGIFRPEDPLDQRIMLLRATFMMIPFYFGVRISDLIDEVRPSHDGELRVWGYSYSTLEGHFERGKIDFEIRENTRTGSVDFKITAFSKPDRIKNIFYRWGFRLFGRGLQLRFAHSSLERMRTLLAQRLDN